MLARADRWGAPPVEYRLVDHCDRGMSRLALSVGRLSFDKERIPWDIVIVSFTALPGVKS